MGGMKKKENKIVIANWKMNPASLKEAKALFSKVGRACSKLRRVEVVACPPFIFLNNLSGKFLKLGAQDVFYENDGRFTGEISPRMLISSGTSHVIVGHSERRELGESDEVISKKVYSVVNAGLKAVLCVGEKDRDGEGKYFEFLKNQIKQSLSSVPSRFMKNIIIAYEPIWAIGRKASDSMKPQAIRETAIFIKKILSDIYDQQIASEALILYGGSVETENVGAIISDGGVSGVLVGHKSLEVDDFIKMLKNIDAI